jgi:multidrug efflux pump subunit AcrA (membrane-fusion protein)
LLDPLALVDGLPERRLLRGPVLMVLVVLVDLDRQQRLAKLEQQLDYCTVRAPSGGLVVYASSLNEGRHGRWSDGQPPQVGTDLSRNEMIMALPDTSRMVAEVKVNEALSGLIEPGQQATVVSDALPEVVLSGVIVGVGVLAESGGWRDPNRRDYTVRILLHDSEDLGLKPSMRCKAEIAIGTVDDSLFVPVQAVFREGADALVYRPESGGYVQQRITLGRASEMYVEVTDGLGAGDRVLLRAPRPQEIIRRTEEQAEQAARAVAERKRGASSKPDGAAP